MAEKTNSGVSRGPPPKLDYRSVMKKHKQEQAAAKVEPEVSPPVNVVPTATNEFHSKDSKSKADESKISNVYVSSTAPPTVYVPSTTASVPVGQQHSSNLPASVSTGQHCEVSSPQHQNQTVSSPENSANPKLNRDAPAFTPHVNVQDGPQFLLANNPISGLLLSARVGDLDFKLTHDHTISLQLLNSGGGNFSYQWPRTAGAPPQNLVHVLKEEDLEVLNNVHKAINLIYNSRTAGSSSSSQPQKPHVDYGAVGQPVPGSHQVRHNSNWKEGGYQQHRGYGNQPRRPSFSAAGNGKGYHQQGGLQHNYSGNAGQQHGQEVHHSMQVPAQNLQPHPFMGHQVPMYSHQGVPMQQGVPGYGAPVFDPHHGYAMFAAAPSPYMHAQQPNVGMAYPNQQHAGNVGGQAMNYGAQQQGGEHQTR